MALFKILKGNRENLNAAPSTEGHAYFCADDGTFWIAHDDGNGNIIKTQINKQDFIDYVNTHFATEEYVQQYVQQYINEAILGGEW